MKESVHKSDAGPARQADNILRAWMCQDSGALWQELKSGLDLCYPAHANGQEEEHLELLQTVVARLEQSRALRGGQPPDPVVRICIDLLLHLAGQVPASSRFTTEPEIPMTYRC